MIFKKVAILVIALGISFSALAQQGKMAVAPQLGIGSGPSIVLGGKLQYGITDPIRLEASFSGLWGKKTYSGIADVSTNGYDLSVNAHYLFSLGDKRWSKDKNTPLFVYPLVGMGIYKATAKASAFGTNVAYSETKIGMNIGCGVEQYFPNDKFSCFAEVKVGLGDGLSRFTSLMGLAYHF